MTGRIWVVEGYYGEQARPPKTPGGFAFRTEALVPSTARVEADAARSRVDLGRVIVIPPEGVERPEWAQCYR